MRQQLIFLISLSLALCNTLLAAEAAHEGGGSGDILGGSWATSLFALIIFALLLAILGRYAWGPILSSLQKREEHIRQSIMDAENTRAEAEKSLKEYQDQLAKARAEAQQIIDKGREAASKLSEELQGKAREQARQLRERAQQDITAAKQQALGEIYDQVATMAVEMAGKVIQKSLDPADHQRLLDESLTQLQNRQN